MSDYYEDPHQNPYWQKLTGNNGQENQSDDEFNRQNTRNTDPNWHPEPEYGRQLARTAAGFGVFSIISCFFLPIAFPAVFGGIAIILAILSKGRGRNFNRSAQHALVTGIIGICVNLFLFIAVFVTFHQMIVNPSMRAQANEVMEQMYGMTFDEVLQQIENDYGISLDGNGIIDNSKENSVSPDSNETNDGNRNNTNSDSQNADPDFPEQNNNTPTENHTSGSEVFA